MAQKKTSPSSTSSAALGDSASDSKQRELFELSHSVSESRSAKPSCESTGPTRRSTTTSEPSTQIDLEELTSSAAVFRASPSPLPGSSEAQKMTEISGRKCCELLKLYKVGGSLAKMSEALLTSHWASSAAFLTWKASGTAPSHLLFQLAPSAPRIDATASGLWPTPTGQDNPQVRGVGKTIGTKRGTTLGGAVRMWPTPTTEPGGGERSGGRKGTGSLAFTVRLLPTPLARDHKGPSMSKERQKTRAPDNLSSWARAKHGSGKLNPWWVEWLMGFPPGWTELKR